MLKKTYTYLTLLAVLGVFTVSCSSDDETFPNDTAAQAETVQIQASMPALNDSDKSESKGASQTRLAFSGYDTESVALAWETGDAFELYAASTTTVGVTTSVHSTFTYTGSTSILGLFSGTNIGKITDAFYPASKASDTDLYDNIVMNMIGQTQVGNDNTSNLDDFTYMTDQNPGVVRDITGLKVSFKHETAQLRFLITLPDDVTSYVTEVKFTAPGENSPFVTFKSLGGTSVTINNSISLSVNGASAPDANHSFIGSMAVLPTTLPEGTYTITVTTEDSKSYEAFLPLEAAMNIESGRVYPINASLFTTEFKSNVLMDDVLTIEDGAKVYINSDATFPEEYNVGEYVKFSTSSVKGEATLTVPTNATKMRFYAIPWAGDKPIIKVGDKGYLKLERGVNDSTNGNACGSGSAVVNFDKFTVVDGTTTDATSEVVSGASMFECDVTGGESIIISSDATTTTTNLRFIIFGLNFTYQSAVN